MAHRANVLSAKPKDLRYISQPTKWKEKMGMYSLGTHTPARQALWESQQVLVNLATTSLFLKYKPGQINEFLELHRFFTAWRSCDTGGHVTLMTLIWHLPLNLTRI